MSVQEHWDQMDADAEELKRRRVESERLDTVLWNLRNEAAGIACMPGLRELIGNTNLACLERRIAEADELLQKGETGK